MRSNRGFWIVVGSMALAGAVLVVLIVVSRPQARRGAVAYAQSNLRRVAQVAAAISERDGSLAAATPARLHAILTDLLFIDPDQSSNDPEVVSVYASANRWVGAIRAETGGCFWLRLEDHHPEPVVGTGTDCSGDAASGSSAGGWPSA
jgi:hypothetical protein